MAASRAEGGGDCGLGLRICVNMTFGRRRWAQGTFWVWESAELKGDKLKVDLLRKCARASLLGLLIGISLSACEKPEQAAPAAEAPAAAAPDPGIYAKPPEAAAPPAAEAPAAPAPAPDPGTY